MESFTDLGQRVRTHICYAQVFGDALTEEQLIARCAPSDPDGVRREVRRLEAAGEVQAVGELWFLRGEAVHGMSALKRDAEAAAEGILRDHRALLQVLKRLSMVRMLAISGSVAWRNHGRRGGRGPDLDLFVIVAPGGVHLVRFLLRVWGAVERGLSRAGWTRPRAPICPNYMTDATFLDISNRSFYTASDAINGRVLKGEDEYRRFVVANAWMSRYYPMDGLTPPAGGTPARNPLLAALNLAAFGVLAACSWLRLKLTARRREPRGVKFEYALRFRFDRNVSLVRSAPSGGGHQPRVARRFEEVYTRHFGPDRALQTFLFPGTTATGVHTPEGHAETTIVVPFAYHE
jgi:hypothetical protein